MQQSKLFSEEQTKGIKYIEYKPKKILNIYKNADSWFWNKYSAHPYIGCEHSCEYCYARERKYLPFEKTEDFGTTIKIKKNAVELLRKELKKVPIDVIAIGDYQPIEEKYQLSRKMLEVCNEYEFPILIIEKSDLVLRDIDLIKKINEKANSVVMFSIITTKDDKKRKLFEPIAPSVERRFKVMREFAKQGIMTGIAFMPILPFIYDNDENLEEVVKMTKENGGKFVLPSTTTLNNIQREWFFQSLKKYDESLIKKYNEIYKGNYVPVEKYNSELSLKVLKLCKKYSLQIRIPRYFPKGKIVNNLNVSTVLFNLSYLYQIHGKEEWKWKSILFSAQNIENLNEDVSEIAKRNELRKIKGVGDAIEKKIYEILESGTCKKYEEMMRG